MESDKIIIGYWAIRGLAESSRTALEYFGLNYESKNYTSRNEWYNKDKATLTTLFPNLPYLKDGTTVVTESDAILLYVICKGNKPEMTGTTTEEKVEIQ